MKPYENILFEDNFFVRLFNENIDPTELKWHRDEKDRVIESIEESDWLIQIENQLPEKIDKICIKKEVWHRLIKGTGELKVKIYEIQELQTV